MDKIGIIGATDKGIDALKLIMKSDSSGVGVSVEKHAGMEFFAGKLSGKNVVLVCSGIGKVNAAIAAEVLAGIFKVDAIINIGMAGGLDNRINIGDIVLSTDALEHDMDYTALGFRRGIVPDQDESVYEADDELRNVAKAACKNVCPYIGVHEGRVVSGDIFVSCHKTKEDLAKTFNALCTEMEGAAVAHTAYVNNIPFLVIKSISDKADDSADMDYPTFQQMAIENSVKLVTEMMSML